MILEFRILILAFSKSELFDKLLFAKKFVMNIGNGLI